MSDEHWDRIASLLRAALSQCEHHLQTKDVANISEFIDVGEYGLAFDTLCTQLDEYGVEVSARVVTILAELGQDLHADPRLWQSFATD